MIEYGSISKYSSTNVTIHFAGEMLCVDWSKYCSNHRNNDSLCEISINHYVANAKRLQAKRNITSAQFDALNHMWEFNRDKFYEFVTENYGVFLNEAGN